MAAVRRESDSVARRRTAQYTRRYVAAEGGTGAEVPRRLAENIGGPL